MKLSTQLGGQTGGKPKILGAMGYPGHTLESPLRLGPLL